MPTSYFRPRVLAPGGRVPSLPLGFPASEGQLAQQLSTILGYRVRADSARRFNTLPLTGQPGARVLSYDPSVLGVAFYNYGGGTVFLDATERVDLAKFPLTGGTPLNFPAPYGPINDWWAVGDAGHDLRVLTVRVY